MDVNARRHCSS